jgi:hypothetical protein
MAWVAYTEGKELDLIETIQYKEPEELTRYFHGWVDQQPQEPSNLYKRTRQLARAQTLKQT